METKTVNKKIKSFKVNKKISKTDDELCAELFKLNPDTAPNPDEIPNMILESPSPDMIPNSILESLMNPDNLAFVKEMAQKKKEQTDELDSKIKTEELLITKQEEEQKILLEKLATIKKNLAASKETVKELHKIRFGKSKPKLKSIGATDLTKNKEFKTLAKEQGYVIGEWVAVKKRGKNPNMMTKYEGNTDEEIKGKKLYYLYQRMMTAKKKIDEGAHSLVDYDFQWNRKQKYSGKDN